MQKPLDVTFELHDAAVSILTSMANARMMTPRPVKRPPYVQFVAPTAWTTLELEIRADGSTEGRLVGASHFPRHWVYGHDGRLVEKSSVIDFKSWAAQHFGDNTPWGDVDSPVVTTAVETALERDIGKMIMREGQKPKIRTLAPQELLCAQGDEGSELYLLLDGVLEVVVGEQRLAEIGPGAVLGERALIEGGRRTSTLRALTRSKVACVSNCNVDRARLELLGTGRHSEERATVEG